MDPGALAFLTALVVVFLAEMGDKSQVVLLAQAARQPPVRVLAEALAAFAVLVLAAVTLGAAAARFLPEWLLAVASGLLFLVFGLLTVREARQPATDEAAPVGSRRGGTFALILVSEMGDKTQLATAALAASSGLAFATGLGAFAGEALASVLAVLAGAWLGRRVSRRVRSWASAVLFLGIGAVTLGIGVWLAL
ncbi:MAG: TMEM165/GDT1 family protein [Candidatus Thermoplasmatota archaeon]